MCAIQGLEQLEGRKMACWVTLFWPPSGHSSCISLQCRRWVGSSHASAGLLWSGPLATQVRKRQRWSLAKSSYSWETRLTRLAKHISATSQRLERWFIHWVGKAVGKQSLSYLPSRPGTVFTVSSFSVSARITNAHDLWHSNSTSRNLFYWQACPCAKWGIYTMSFVTSMSQQNTDEDLGVP